MSWLPPSALFPIDDEDEADDDGEGDEEGDYEGDGEGDGEGEEYGEGEEEGEGDAPVEGPEKPAATAAAAGDNEEDDEEEQFLVEVEDDGTPKKPSTAPKKEKESEKKKEEEKKRIAEEETKKKAEEAKRVEEKKSESTTTMTATAKPEEKKGESKDEAVADYLGFPAFDMVSEIKQHHFQGQSTDRSMTPLVRLVNSFTHPFIFLLPFPERVDSSGRKTAAKMTGKLQSLMGKELRGLSAHTPSGIFVRAAQDRIDLIKFMILGVHETPYFNGCFAFDLSVASDYPATPPLCHYHSYGFRLNPNLYIDGKVCCKSIISSSSSLSRIDAVFIFVFCFCFCFCVVLHTGSEFAEYMDGSRYTEMGSKSVEPLTSGAEYSRLSVGHS